jgi:outer membrane protein assembly factor BamA
VSKFEFANKDWSSDVQYYKINAIAEYYIPISSKHNVILSGIYAFAGSGTPFYKWFYFGGPRTFVGVDYYQANGTEFTITQASYRYEFFKDIYIKGIFNAMFNYNMWSYDEPIRGKTLYGGAISFIMKTMFGRTELMFARGESNLYSPGKKENTVYFTFGYKLL